MITATAPPSATETVQLAEWALSLPVHLSVDERRALERHFDATVTTESVDTFRILPGSVVGSINVGSRVFVVTPKIPIDRVLFMTAYAADPHRWQDDWSSITTTPTLTDGIASLFVSACQRTLTRGLLRSYRTVDASATAVKGRVRWPRQARQVSPLPIAVRYQVHDDDILENQLLRAAAAALRRQRIGDQRTSFGLTRLWQQLRDLSPITATPELVDRITWTRQNAHYQPLLRLVRTILAGAMLDVGSGTTPVPGFTLRLYDVFEQFVRVALREAFRATTTELPDNPRDHKLYLDEAHRVALEPDLGLKVDGDWRSSAT